MRKLKVGEICPNRITAVRAAMAQSRENARCYQAVKRQAQTLAQAKMVGLANSLRISMTGLRLCME